MLELWTLGLITPHIRWILKGAGLGLLIGVASVAINGQDKGLVLAFEILDAPVECLVWLSQKMFGLSNGSAALMGWLGTAFWMMILGGLIGWGVSVLLGGDE